MLQQNVVCRGADIDICNDIFDIDMLMAIFWSLIALQDRYSCAPICYVHIDIKSAAILSLSAGADYSPSFTMASATSQARVKSPNLAIRAMSMLQQAEDVCGSSVARLCLRAGSNICTKCSEVC